MLFSVHWEKFPVPRQPHLINVQVTFLDTEGRQVQFTRRYEEWIGVCTNNIQKVVRTVQHAFPNCHVRYAPLGTRRKVLPYFPTKLQKQRLDLPAKPFYKLYAGACHEEIGQLLNKFKLSYYEKKDWMVRLYIDLCSKHNTQGFYYKWYSVNNTSPWLLHSFDMLPEHTRAPDWTIAAFDLETVPMDGADRVPTGLDPTDEIVMISLYKWNRKKGLEKWLFYRTIGDHVVPDFPEAIPYKTEASMLNDFHVKIQDAHVLTGYNIDRFDFPCLFNRLVWLGKPNVLRHYSSAKVGQSIVTTFQNKLVLDLYPYFKTFSNYDLPGFKLDNVARAKLNETKVQIDSTGLWAWYTHPDAPSIIHDPSVDHCWQTLQPRRLTPSQFGTFRQYMEYCLQDSSLVYRLFEKEMVLSFAVERANFTAWDAVKALHMGNSNFLLELFKTYGNVLGFFINTHFFSSPIDGTKYESMFVNDKYQGALNYCMAQQSFEDVSVMDFASMYPNALLSSNLDYSTCTIMTRDEWKACPLAQTLTCIPYRVHDDRDFQTSVFYDPFRYPPYDPELDEFVIVINEKVPAFLPCVVKHFIELRQHHQRQYKQSKDVYHYNAQLCIKILINSLYGVMANKNSCLEYLPIAMTIVTLARYQLLGSYHFLKRQNYTVCYADTDSLMVHQWPTLDCREVNEYLNIPHVELKYEQRMRRLLVLSKKRYVYETQQGKIVKKGFGKRINDLLKDIVQFLLDTVWKLMYEEPLYDYEGVWWEPNLTPESRGWLLWMHVLQETLYKCRDPKKYSICRKTKPLHEYKSKTCAAVRMLQRYPEKANDYIDYTYSRADVSQKEASKWVMDVQDCQWVNYEQLIMSQKRIICLLLNVAYWKRAAIPMDMCNFAMNAIRWKQFMHAELLHWHKTGGRRVELLVEKGCKYTFCINDHVKRTKGRAVKRKQNAQPVKKKNSI